jgi:tRNA dimethylallyltransferase
MPRNAERLPPLPPCVVITGPTAAGKTEFAISLAERFPVRLISVDSVQVYRGLDVGSAKPDPETLARFPHALIDVRDPDQPYTAADFARDAEDEILRARASGQLPVVVGGTALYLRALRYGLDPMPRADPGYRKLLSERGARDGWPALHAELARLDPAAGRAIRPGDPQRIQRALELHHVTRRRPSELRSGRGPDRMRDSLMIVITPADRAALHRRIERRWERMLAYGLVDEVQRIAGGAGWNPDLPALRAVGYRQTIEYLSGRIPRRELPARGAAATRQLAKRQLTSFRQWSGGLWFDPLNHSTNDRIIKRVGRFAGDADCAGPGTEQVSNSRAAALMPDPE